MNEKQAIEVVARMYAAHGTTKPPEVVAELAAEMLESQCHSCAKATIEDARTQGSKPLTVPAYRETYRRVYGSPEHQFHIGQNETQVDVGKIEARWRRDDVRALVDAGMPRDHAQVASAIRWANGTCDIGTDLDLVAWSRHLPKTITERTITAAWDYARGCATKNVNHISDEEWDAIVDPWRAAWREAMA